MEAPMKLKLIQLKMLENLNPILARIPDSKSTFLEKYNNRIAIFKT